MDRHRGLLRDLYVDIPLLCGLLALCAIGLIVLYSATGENNDVVLRQLIHICIGLVAMLGLAQIDPTQMLRWTPWLYGLGLMLLVAVMFYGAGRGATRWLDLMVLRFQPSELMKIMVPMMLAWYLNERPVPPNLWNIIVAGLVIAIPVGFIVRQPDLGTAVMIVAIGGGAIFLAGVRWRLIGFAGLSAIAGAPLLWLAMHDYQRQRILTMFDPEKDPLGTGYHIIQSKIAVGSGGLYGKGWLNGTQSHLEFVPERSTDFIFAVFCEEFGFIGVLVLMAIYLFVIFRGLFIAVSAQDTFRRLLAGSLSLTLFLYVLVNMGMVSGQLPVVGIPLPLISYGGTSVVTLMASFGILMSIHTHKRWLGR